MNIIILEDEGITAMFLEESLEGLGYSVQKYFDNAENLLGFLQTNSNVDLLLLDIKVKGKMNGIECANIVKQTYEDIPIVFISSYKDSETIKNVKNISPLGYLIKPVMQHDIEALMMVVEGRMENKPEKESLITLVEDYVFDIDTQILSQQEKSIALTAKELLCLSVLVSHRHKYVKKEQLISIIWSNENGSDRTDSLRELIYRLRKKIPNLPLTSTYNIGYLLSV